MDDIGKIVNFGYLGIGCFKGLVEICGVIRVFVVWR